MDDDFDDLLDEIEKEFARKENSSSGVQRNTNLVIHREAPVTTQNGDDIDEDIDDILAQSADFSDKNAKDKTGKTSSNNACPRQDKNVLCNKCYPVYLGGTNMAKGLCVTGQRKACNNLRCTSCDFRVLNFDNFQWHSSADYLFFRNKMPDKLKLQSKLRKMVGYNSYCCQCSWKNIKEPTALSCFKDLKWVCGKHS